MQKNIIYHADACMKGRRSCSQERILPCLLFVCVCVWDAILYTHTLYLLNKTLFFLLSFGMMHAGQLQCVCLHTGLQLENNYLKETCICSHWALILGNKHNFRHVCIWVHVQMCFIWRNQHVHCQIMVFWTLVGLLRHVHIPKYIWANILSKNSE